MEPNAQFAGKFQHVEGSSVGPHHVMGGAIALPTDFIEDVIDFAAHNAAIAQSAQEVELGFAIVFIQPSIGRCQLRQQLRKLAQLNQTQVVRDRL
jgi:hypothetical protein